MSSTPISFFASCALTLASVLLPGALLPGAPLAAIDASARWSSSAVHLLVAFKFFKSTAIACSPPWHGGPFFWDEGRLGRGHSLVQFDAIHRCNDSFCSAQYSSPFGGKQGNNQPRNAGTQSSTLMGTSRNQAYKSKLRRTHSRRSVQCALDMRSTDKNRATGSEEEFMTANSVMVVLLKTSWLQRTSVQQQAWRQLRNSAQLANK